MTEITIPIPTIGTVSEFSFKTPFRNVVNNKLGINDEHITLEVISISDLRDMIREDRRDPYSTIYQPAGVSEVDYKLDLDEGVKIISFLHIDESGFERILKIPINYVNQTLEPSSIRYDQRILTLNLGYLPSNLNLDPIYKDVADYIATRVGVRPEVKDVTIGESKFHNGSTHQNFETIRKNSVKVNKTMTVQLDECKQQLSAYVRRIDELGIRLGEIEEEEKE